jgi:hypothetical protein
MASHFKIEEDVKSMAEEVGVEVVMDFYGKPFPPLEDIDIDRMHPIAYYPDIGSLQGNKFMTRGGGRAGVVVYGSLYVKGETTPRFSLGDVFVEYVKTDTGDFAQNQVHNIFRGFALVVDAKPRLGTGNAAPPKLSMASAMVLGQRFKGVGRCTGGQKKTLTMMEASSNNTLTDLKTSSADALLLQTNCPIKIYAYDAECMRGVRVSDSRHDAN